MLRCFHDLFADQLISVVIHGSLALDDLAPGYSDIDFLAVVAHDLDEPTCRRLVEMRQPFRRGDHGIFGGALEGPFLPRVMLNPAITGHAFCWGTSGERAWTENKLGGFASELIRERGIVIYGEHVRSEIPAATREELLVQCRAACADAARSGRAGTLHSVDWLLTIARLLLWVKEGRLSSKTEAADWASRQATGAWRGSLPRAKALRLQPALAERAETRRWLDGLIDPIRQAAAELRSELSARG